MKLVGFAGYSGSGKTTLVEKLVAAMKASGLRVSVLKHAHHALDIDQPGKDSWRHRQAGACEVLVVSAQRMALMREFDSPGAWDLQDLLAQLDARADWVLLEGFKASPVPKIEVWRAPEAGQAPRPVRYPSDPHICAVATDDVERLPQATAMPRLDLNDAAAVLQFLLDNQADFEHRPAAAP
jgi:molybdopterin-guanine dinucleotide biosynthesis protein B